MAYYNDGTVGEKFDGRTLFHMRRSELHQEIAKWSIKAMADPKHCKEWCSALMQLHRMLWGSFEKVSPKESKNGDKIPFNEYLEENLWYIQNKIMEATNYSERSDGEVNVLVDRKKISKVPKLLDALQKEMGMIEYKKNLDLPRSEDPVIKATRAR